MIEMKVKAEKEWIFECSNCNENYILLDEEFFQNETTWTCIKCGLELIVWRDDNNE